MCYKDKPRLATQGDTLSHATRQGVPGHTPMRMWTALRIFELGNPRLPGILVLGHAHHFSTACDSSESVSGAGGLPPAIANSSKKKHAVMVAQLQLELETRWLRCFASKVRNGLDVAALRGPVRACQLYF